jgi:hypothetical protein
MVRLTVVPVIPLALSEARKTAMFDLVPTRANGQPAFGKFVCRVSRRRRRAHSEAAYRLGSDRGSPNHGSALFSKRVMPQIRSPVRVRTRRPVPWRMPVAARR